MNLTDKQLLSVYMRMVGDAVTDDDPRREAIIGEMRAVIAAPDDRAAGEVIEWWEAGNWDEKGTPKWNRSPTAWAAEYRRRAARAAEKLERAR